MGSDSGYDGPDCDQRVTLAYNGRLELEARRERLARSCLYFAALLAGPWSEAGQRRVEIHLSADYDFDTFRRVVEFAAEGRFERGPQLFATHVAMIQLASMWLYDELVELLEASLLEQLDLDSLALARTLANMLGLPRLRAACQHLCHLLDSNMSNLVRAWPRCALAGHSDHSYVHCSPLPGAWPGEQRARRGSRDARPPPPAERAEEARRKSTPDRRHRLRHRLRHKLL